MEQHTDDGVLVPGQLEAFGFTVKEKGTTLRVSGGTGSRISRLTSISQKYNSPILRDRPKLSSIGYVRVGSWRIVVKDDKQASTHYEEEVIRQMNEAYNKYRPEFLLIGPKAYKLYGTAKKVPGVPKADIRWSDVWISHKAGSTTHDFQQYSGISEAAGGSIYNHHETQRFLEGVAKRISDGKLQRPAFARIGDPRLKVLAVYGSDAYKFSYGPNHVQCVGQGDPIFTEEDGQLRLNFTGGIHTHDSIYHLDGDYEPVFAATFRTGRCFIFDGKRYEGARVGIYPYGQVKGRTNLLDLNPQHVW